MDYQSHTEKDPPNQDPPHVPEMHYEAPSPFNGVNREVAPPPLSKARTEMDKLIQVLLHLTMSQQTFQQQQPRQMAYHYTSLRTPTFPGWPFPNQAAPTASPNHVRVESLPSDVAPSKGCGPPHQVLNTPNPQESMHRKNPSLEDPYDGYHENRKRKETTCSNLSL